MSTIKLKNTSGGSLSLSSTDSAADSTLSLPAFSGSLVAADVSGNVGIGTTTAIAGTKLHVLEGAVSLSAYSAEAGILTRKANGTEAVPTATTINQRSTILVGASYGGSTWVNNTGISFYASENQSETARGSHITFETTGIGGTSRSERMRLDSAGRLGINTSSPNVLLDISSGTPNTVGDPITTGQVNIAGPDTGAVYAGNLNISSTDTAAANLGGSIYFGGKWNGTTQAKWAFVKGACTTTGNYGGYLSFGTRPDGGSLTEKLRITGEGNLRFPNMVTTNDHIQLYGAGGTTGYGIGVEGSTLYYRSGGSTHRWYIQSLANGGSAGSAAYLTTSGFYTRDVIAGRTATTGYVFLGTDNTKYIGYDGTNYILPSANLYLNGAWAVTTAGTTFTGLLATKCNSVANLYDANDTCFSVRGDATYPAAISFHRVGAYAINFGLSTDNIFRLGGWSHGAASRWYSDTSGNFVAQANISAYSDERVKTNWADIPDTFLQDLAKIKHGTYDRTDTNDKIRQVGVSAQSLQKILPEAILEDTDGMLSVAYGNAALVACVELAKEIQILKEEIRLLKEIK